MVLKSTRPLSPCWPAAISTVPYVVTYVASCFFAHSSTLVQASLLVHVRRAYNVRSSPALRSRGTSRLRTACRRGCYYRRRWTRVRGVRSGIGVLGRGARCFSPPSTCGGLLLHSADFSVDRHQSSEVHHSYNIICTSLWMLLRKTAVTIVILCGLVLHTSTWRLCTTRSRVYSHITLF